MTIAQEFTKLKSAKTGVRKSIQRQRTGLTLSTLFPDYHEYIHSISSSPEVDETGLADYVEDRCYSLELKVNKIRAYAFRNYSCLQEIYLNNSNVVELENVNAFYGISPKILVPSNLVSQYKTAPNWSKISDRIEAYTSRTAQDMFILQHINRVQTLGWLQNKTILDLTREFRF